MVLTRIVVMSVAKIFGVLNAAIGLIIGICIALFSLIGAGMTAAVQQSGAPTWIGAVFGIGAIIFLPILYGTMGFIFGAIWAALYNLFAGMVGGIEIEMRQSIAP